ncbi:glycosyltransferase [Xanthomonadaceae bacterium XH05]|nr:glycosyltransferase [Xanthomonadaceae bacterium XH05]
MQLLPALESGGVERSTLEVAQALVRNGHHALVVSAGGRLVSDLTASGAIHITLDIGRKSLLTLRHIGRLRRLIEQHRPDVVHARSRLPAWIGWLALRGMRGTKPAFVTTVHGLNSVSAYSAIMTRGERVICVSETVRAHVLAHYPSTDPARLRVIERGVDAQDFPSGHRADAAWRTRFYGTHPALRDHHWFVLPGRGTRLKGHRDAIELIGRLHDAGHDVALLLQGVVEAGRDAYLDELRAQAAQRGVADRVVFAAPRRDIREVMAESFAILQLSTKPEAFGRTVAEALSLGKPVLGWDRGGVGELLARGFPEGAVAAGDMEALTSRAAQWLVQPPRVATFTPMSLQAMQDATLALYREVADAR